MFFDREREFGKLLRLVLAELKKWCWRNMVELVKANVLFVGLLNRTVRPQEEA